MTPEQLKTHLMKRYGGIGDYAKRFKLVRSGVYRALDGEGMRSYRIMLAREADLLPSLIWPQRSKRVKLLDDIDFLRATGRPLDSVLQEVLGYGK